jgi:tellurite resistance-related uncharacterized protein
MNDLKKEFDLLLLSYEDESISDEDFNKLQQLLEEHEDLRKRFVRHQMITAKVYGTNVQPLVVPSFEKPKRALPIMQIFMYAAAALLIIAGVLKYNQQDAVGKSIAHFTALDNKNDTVSIIRNGKNIPITSDTELQVNDKIATSTNEVFIRYKNEETVIIIKENSILELKEKEGAKRLYLRQGAIICDVDKQPDGKPMIIYTKQSKSTVLGTQFLLSTTEDHTNLSVMEGSVEMEEKDSKKSVTAKAGWQAKTAIGTIKVFPINYSDSKIKINKLILIDPDQEKTIAGFDPFVDGMVIDMDVIDSRFLNIFIDADEKYVGGIFSIFKGIDNKGKTIRIYNERGQNRNKGREKYYPYFLLGDGKDGREEKPLRWEPAPGKYTLSLTPYGQHKKLSTLGQNVTINFTIIKSK